MNFLDAEALAQLKNLRLSRRRQRTEGLFSGGHPSTRFGFAQEFAHHREYVPGDELKFLDWRASARRDRPFVKLFEEDVALHTSALLDASGSMGYQASGARSKWRDACSLAEALSFLFLSEGDAVGLVTFDVKPGEFLPARSQLTHLELIDSLLAKIEPKGETDLGATLRLVSRRLTRRSLVFLVSDLLGPAEAILEVVHTLRSRKNEVWVVQVLDPMERDLTLEGPVQFEGIEDASTLRCEVSLLRKAYRDEFEKRQRLYQAGFHRLGVPYAVHCTDRPWFESLRGLLGALA